MASNAEFGEQGLHGRDLVGLVSAIDITPPHDSTTFATAAEAGVLVAEAMSSFHWLSKRFARPP